MPTPKWEQWVDRDPMYVHREYNWRDVFGNWRRRYVGIGNGRHRFLEASRRHIEVLPVQVLELAFWPVHERPLDRAHIPHGQRCFSHQDFDHVRRTWHSHPVTSHERDATCPSG